jgi:predicted nucleotidyltransferase
MNPFLRVIDAIKAADVRFVIVGGFAAYLHGSRRVTVDLDLVVDLSAVGARRVIEALLSIGMESRLPVDPLSFADPAARRRWADEKQMLVFTMLDPKNPGFVVDLFVESPMDFDEFHQRAKDAVIDGRTVRICAIEDLIAMKEKAGRPQDLADVRTLRRIQSMND